MNFERKSGVLLHISSLPGRWGTGELGPQARAFGDFLKSAGQKLWQILPTGPVGYGWSPYSSVSAFAGNHLFISFDDLLEDGLLTKRQLSAFPVFDSHHIDFDSVIAAREKILFRVAERFESNDEFENFCTRENSWLDDYSLFMAIREIYPDGTWAEWPPALRDRKPAAMKQARVRLKTRIHRHKVLQFLFDKHWKKTSAYFHSLGISIAGDIPIFVAGDSANVWSNRELFFLDEAGRATVVAGVPPDYFSETGQRWGNPLYNWTVHRESGYEWWTRRMQRMFEMTDVVRVDHFRGFESYWEIPASEPTAVNGRWVNGPGLEFFQTLENNLRRIPALGKKFKLDEHVIAENLGIITDEVEALREACGFPGMWVLHFRFGDFDLKREGYRVEGVEKNWAVYTGTHDNDTTQNWYAMLNGYEQSLVRNYLRTDGSAIHRTLVELALQSPAKWAVLPMQDVLGAGERMNRPGIANGNWSWRFTEDMIAPETVSWLRDVTERNGR